MTFFFGSCGRFLYFNILFLITSGLSLSARSLSSLAEHCLVAFCMYGFSSHVYFSCALLLLQGIVNTVMACVWSYSHEVCLCACARACVFHEHGTCMINIRLYVFVNQKRLSSTGHCQSFERATVLTSFP